MYPIYIGQSATPICQLKHWDPESTFRVQSSSQASQVGCLSSAEKSEVDQQNLKQWPLSPGQYGGITITPCPR